MTAPASPETYALHRTSPLALAAEFFGVVAAFAALSIATGAPATSCGWCETNAFDVAVRELLYRSDPRVAAGASHVFSMALAPALAFGAVTTLAWRTSRRRHAAQDAVIVINALLLTMGITDAVKKLADRERPGFHFGRRAVLEAANIPTEHFLSFFSGDTACAFVFVTAAATLASLRGHRDARRIAIAGVVVAAVAGILRIAADMHWATDVMMGASVGTAVGVGLPRLLHGRVAAQGAP